MTIRHATLDGVRGVAVMGIVLMNVAEFALPQGTYLAPLLGGRTPADIAIWVAELVLADGKFRNLFSALFGASMLLVAERAEAAGRNGARGHYARMGWLLPIGLAHLTVLWRGDILHHYAIVGSVAFLLRRLPAHKLATLAVVVLVLDLLVLTNGVLVLHAMRAAATASPDAMTAWTDMLATLRAPPPAALAGEAALHHGPWWAAVRARMSEDAGLPVTELLVAGPETFALMLLGMAAFRSGFLTGGWERSRYVRVALLCYGIGIPAMLGLAGWVIASGFDPLTAYTALMAASLPVRAPLAFGHAALLILWFGRPPGPLRRRIAAVGRAAFSNYLLTSGVMVALFDGAELFGRLDRAALLIAVVGMWALMLAWSAPWLRRFHYGPMEWLWRSLARATPQPMRRNEILPIARHYQ